MDRLCLLFCIILIYLHIDQMASAQDHAHSRKKRYLIFPQGSNIQLVYCLTIGSYAQKGDLVLGLTAALAWELPNTIDPKLKGSLHRQTRAVLYPKIEAFLQSTGVDGSSCLMRALCETGQRPSLEIGSGTFIQELLHAVFTLRDDGTIFDDEYNQRYDYAHKSNKKCAEIYSFCKYSIYDLSF